MEEERAVKETNRGGGVSRPRVACGRCLVHSRGRPAGRPGARQAMIYRGHRSRSPTWLEFSAGGGAARTAPRRRPPPGPPPPRRIDDAWNGAGFLHHACVVPCVWQHDPQCVRPIS
jgi:hypothetical protein